MPLVEFFELEHVARERIDEGLLPRTLPRRVWGSPRGAGELCSLCDRAISPYQSVLELDGRPELQFHVACHAIWEQECRARARRAGQAQRTAESPRA
jgi:hypothetical protein